MNTEQAAEAVNEICRRIGTSAEYIVPQFSKMKAAGSVFSVLICGVLSAVLISAFAFGLKKLIAEEKKQIDLTDLEQNLYMIMTAAGGLFSILFAIFFIIGIYDAVMWHAFPEAETVEYIIGLARGA